MSASILLGAVLSFANSDTGELQLTVSLSRSATASLAWGDLIVGSSTAATEHVFRPLPAPREAAIDYRLFVGAEPPVAVSVDPIGKNGKMRIAVYGDSREGSATHRVLLEQMNRRNVDLIIHTGDVVRVAGDEPGWIAHLSALFPLSSRRPILLALGNHEIWQPSDAKVNGLQQTMERMPPPVDALAKQTGAPIAAFHVRVGPVLIISLDSNSDLSATAPQIKFLEEVLKRKGDAKFVFVCWHHGPLSSGPHGGHPYGSVSMRLMEKYGVTASIAGHDHVYERIIYNNITYLISGGGGAPLYQQRQIVPGSKAFASAYNWTELTIDGDRVSLESFSLEGGTLDRADVVPLKEEGATGRGEGAPRGLGTAAVVFLVIAFVWVGRRLARAGR